MLQRTLEVLFVGKSETSYVKIVGRICVPTWISNEVHLVVSRKQYKGTAGEGLLLPSDTIQNLLEEFEQEIRSIFQTIIHMNRVCYRLVSALSKVAGKSLDCSQCQTKALIVNLFVTIRLNHFLRETNGNFVGMKGRRNRKVVKFSHD